MSDTTTVKIGVTFAPREIELAVEDVEAFVAAFERAMASDDPVWWVTDSSGRRRGLVVDKVSYVDIEAEKNRTIGFSG
jgi:hypothetical protein